MSCVEEKTDCSSQTGMSCLLDVECEASEVKQKQKQQTLTLCEVCNIQLNSSAQAQIHYNGKTHQRRLRQAYRAKTSGGARNSTGSPAKGSGLLTSLPVQPKMDLKHFLPIRMDPVQKAVISHTFSIAHSLKKKQIITCNICHLRFNSTNQAEAHYKGHKHARKLKAIDKLKNKQRILGRSVWRGRERKEAIAREMEDSKWKDSSLSERTAPIHSSEASSPEDDRVQGLSVTLRPVSHTSPSKRLCESKCIPESSALVPPADPKSIVKGNRNRRKCSKSLQCAVCKVTVNSGSQLEDHYKGSKHRLMLGGHCMLPRKRGGKADSSHTAPRSKRLHVNSASSDQSHHCNVCDIDVNSEAQLQQHMRSRRHRDRATGKSLHTKFSPYINNSAHTVLTTKLTLQKELSRTLTSGLLTSAPMAMATGPLSLSHVHPQAAIVHAPLFSHTLLRPAPGPFRAAQGPVIFCPY
ncbi:zinc finger protein 385B-like isoform X2 [Hemibagrus wyckioides]|uniref:zinc finger protein 385B-like isoform X2 n=1 Tax=Hemibagrus wyckioides TaxID=337641 RepID=UPI00266C4BA5|nr:zinc finger protein 385B-like isoform X2 [Hemibagrus wyckioides]